MQVISDRVKRDEPRKLQKRVHTDKRESLQGRDVSDCAEKGDSSERRNRGVDEYEVERVEETLDEDQPFIGG
jgi:hypothetical protein